MIPIAISRRYRCRIFPGLKRPFTDLGGQPADPLESGCQKSTIIDFIVLIGNRQGRC